MSKPSLDLKAFRKRHNLTQSALAKKLGFSRSYIATAETAREGLSICMMLELIRNFDVDCEDFYLHEEW